MEKKKFDELDEIVFSDRNKDFGAYFLRTTYRRHVVVGLAITITAMLIGVGIPMLAAYLNKSRLVREDKTVGVELANLNKPPEDAPPPPPPPPPPEMMEQKVKFTAPVVVEDTADETQAFVQDDLANQNNKPVNDEEIVVTDDKANEVIEEAAPQEIFTIVEEQPSYPGGEDGRIKFLSDNIKYPDLARENGIQGTVYVTFVVEPDGSISNISVLRGIGAGCDEEAIRVVKQMPKWNAGKQRGKNVRVKINMPIKFVVVE
jgi:periplasmic protein TonB